MKEEGTGRQKVLPDPILEFFSVSPDGKWSVIAAPVPSKKNPASILAYGMNGDTSIRVCEGYCVGQWDRGGKFFYVAFPGFGSKDVLKEIRWLPGVKVIDAAISPGPSASVYVFTRESVHRNL